VSAVAQVKSEAGIVYPDTLGAPFAGVGVGERQAEVPLVIVAAFPVDAGFPEALGSGLEGAATPDTVVGADFLCAGVTAAAGGGPGGALPLPLAGAPRAP
jgi:hypothetical protein